MTFDEARAIFEMIESSSLSELKEDLFKSAVRYSNIRANWYFAHSDSRKEMDRSRTISHNAFIDACNILSRNMAKAGEDISWRESLGDDRKNIGDIASYLGCFLGIKAR